MRATHATPDVPPADDNASDKTQSNLATLTAQAVGEINALKDAYRAAGCIHGLVVSARAARDDDLLSGLAKARTIDGSVISALPLTL